MTQQRALLAIRLSVRTDETTSPERQEEACRSAATHYGLSVAGVASDIDVSATKTTPWERPELGKWLNDRSHEFDAVIWWKLDRAVRSMADMSELVRWARTHGKRLIFAEGPGGGSMELDLTGDEFEALQQVLNSRRRAKVDRRDTDSLLLGVVHCASCGKRMYFNRSRTGRTEPYACSIYKSGMKCPGAASIKGTTADEYATAKFLDVFGRVEYTEAIEHGGDDPRPEIARTAEELDLMASQLANASSDAERQVWKARVTALGKRLAELESRPIVEPWTEQRPTGQTIADVWAQSNTTQRRGMLREAGARLWVYPRKQRPTDRMEFVVTAPEWAQLAESLSTIATDESD